MSEQCAEQPSRWARPHVSGRAIIRRAELQRRIPFSTVHIWRLERLGEFPARVQLGPHAVGWYLDEVEGWIESRIRAGGRSPKRQEVPAEATPEPRPRLSRRAPTPVAPK